MRVVFLILAALICPALARAGDERACMAAIAAAGSSYRALQAIAVVESGRLVGGRVVPWPWSVNAGGTGRFYASKAEAIAAVGALRASGLQSIDVGCMQVNLAAHPDGFRSLDEAFDPAANVAYAARFFHSLYAESGRWTVAMTAYHSRTPPVAAEYARRLLAVWPEAATYGLAAEAGPAVRGAAGPERSSILPAAFPVHGPSWPAGR